jgi:hypothetical protein
MCTRTCEERLRRLEALVSAMAEEMLGGPALRAILRSMDVTLRSSQDEKEQYSSDAPPKKGAAPGLAPEATWTEVVGRRKVAPPRGTSGGPATAADGGRGRRRTREPLKNTMTQKDPGMARSKTPTIVTTTAYAPPRSLESGLSSSHNADITPALTGRKGKGKHSRAIPLIATGCGALKVARRTVAFSVWPLEAGTEEAAIEAHIRVAAGLDNDDRLEVMRLPNRGAFKVVVEDHRLQAAMALTAWPTGLRLRRYYERRAGTHALSKQTGSASPSLQDTALPTVEPVKQTDESCDDSARDGNEDGARMKNGPNSQPFRGSSSDRKLRSHIAK